MNRSTWAVIARFLAKIYTAAYEVRLTESVARIDGDDLGRVLGGNTGTRDREETRELTLGAAINAREVLLNDLAHRLLAVLRRIDQAAVLLDENVMPSVDISRSASG